MSLEIINGLMGVKQLSEYLNVPTSTIYGLTMRAKIPCCRIGRSLRFRKADIDAWLENSACNGEGLER